MGNAYNLEDRYCSGLQRKNSSIPIQFDPCFRFPDSLTSGIRKSVGFGFAGSRRSAIAIRMGYPLDAQVGEDPLVFEFTNRKFLLVEQTVDCTVELRYEVSMNRYLALGCLGLGLM